MGAMNPYNDEDMEISRHVDCCICLNVMAPFQALFLAPCSHCFHYKCATPLLGAGFMFQCPMCRQVANLDATVASDDQSEVSECDMQEADPSSEEDEDVDAMFDGGVTLGRQGRQAPSRMAISDQRDDDDETPMDVSTNSQTVPIPSAIPTINFPLQAGTQSMPINIDLADTYVASPMTPPNHTWAVPNNSDESIPLVLYRLLNDFEHSISRQDADSSRALLASYAASMARFLAKAPVSEEFRAELNLILK